MGWYNMVLEKANKGYTNPTIEIQEVKTVDIMSASGTLTNGGVGGEIGETGGEVFVPRG